MKRKHFLAIVALIAMFALLTACGAKNVEETAASTVQETVAPTAADTLAKAIPTVFL